VAVALAVALLAAEIRSSGRARRPQGPREAAVAAFEKASVSPGSAWSARELGVARAALDAALLDCSRQENRPFALRDFRPAAEAFKQARALASEAERLGDERRAEVLSEAEAVVREARELEAHALALVAKTTLPPAQRARLQRARLLVREAEALVSQGEVRAARERALRSKKEMRKAVGPALAKAERYRSQDQVATWQRWIEDARRHSRKQPTILVLKEKNLLLLLERGVPVRRYEAEVGANGLGEKARQGDRATPEGRYKIEKKKDRGQSTYHRALLLDYPNKDDRKRFEAAKKRGEIPRRAGIGGLIEIHGGGGRGQNWTDGCVALKNSDMDELFARVRVGTRVTIVGGDGSDGAFSSLLARVR
jgi:lipoprotein-anchoring transpeptidase ErfK/SrfK